MTYFDFFISFFIFIVVHLEVKSDRLLQVQNKR